MASLQSFLTWISTYAQANPVFLLEYDNPFVWALVFGLAAGIWYLNRALRAWRLRRAIARAEKDLLS